MSLSIILIHLLPLFSIPVCKCTFSVLHLWEYLFLFVLCCALFCCFSVTNSAAMNIFRHLHNFLTVYLGILLPGHRV